LNTANTFADTLPAQWPADSEATPSRWLDSVSKLLMRWHDAARSRQTLDELDDHLLRDIGLTRAEARRESSKFFWQT
jgi:uncharacterized protein YjiS (DUF1127 family)